MSLTTSGIKGVVTYFMGATPSATVTLQAVSAPGLKNTAVGIQELRRLLNYANFPFLVAYL